MNGMMPWKDQVRLGGSILRRAFWPADQRAWANATAWVVAFTMAIAIVYQLWLLLLVAAVLYVLVRWAGQKWGRP